MESPTGGRRRRPCFIEEDDGLVSLAETEAGFSGNNNKKLNQYPLISRSLYYTKNLSSILSPRSVVLEEPQQHFLEACFLCKKRLALNSDIFMYRGDTPFCSEECRQQQIEKDEAKEKKWKISSIKALRKKEKSESTSPSKTTEDYPLRPGTVAAA